ncbi:N-6 DNA methylase [Hominifimenecus sp. rT4P-3]|uniref:N-6 DNA methylase n=1 Tax=Hominifimenecus sp. rT4P-3 TaxID=3242979 RepID=UPI003DA5F389
MKNWVSEATKKNWKRLYGDSPNGRLTARANKSQSKRYILPEEMLTCRKNRELVQQLTKWTIEKGCEPGDALYTLGIRLLKKAGLWEKRKERPKLCNFLKGIKRSQTPFLQTCPLPEGEDDFLGLFYQCLRNEGEKNRKGAYYTPPSLVKRMLTSLDLSGGKTLLDPCCGSGAFLLGAKDAFPEQLIGFDIDPIAVMIAGFNFYLHFPELDFEPKLFCLDFLDLPSWIREKTPDSYDYIVTNPPWGSVVGKYSQFPEIVSRERFSLFLVQAYSLLSSDGELRFLLPESVLNVKIHRDIRRFLLEQTHLQEILFCPENFAGVSTKSVSLTIKKQRTGSEVRVTRDGNSFFVPVSYLQMDENFVYRLWPKTDREILTRLLRQGEVSLENSLWGLGIVTGRNREALSDAPGEGREPVYTGKQIQPYRLLPPVKFIRYDRERLQQAAKDELYRAPEKLVYKFISNRLVFARDTSGGLLLNSANLLIPQVPGMSAKALLVFLNSELYGYLYQRLFGEIKILQGNLKKLPLPLLSWKEQEEAERLCRLIEQGGKGRKLAVKEAEDFVYSRMGVTDSERIYIHQCMAQE